MEGADLDFQLSDEQQQLRRSVREFAERELLPNVMKWDEAGEFTAENMAPELEKDFEEPLI